ncbi:probable long-chain-alcohol O-fatty-acyltransferase 5 [Lolium perenne]|uniref:probable long-chain-alcohol O-fatty-acyltransferase 5 n=1 Tax=Lolium perenne TaxID=4522 RepID=UPI0021EA89EF|nr:probable long-chain-alcohol O-fatty-acyltransferase 5 [Lolium perenne]
MQGLQQPTSASELRALAWTAFLVPVCTVYARSACRRLRPGRHRLAALFPTFLVFIYLPCLFNSLHLRLLSTFFHTWLATNKLVLLALDLGPLHPSLPLLPFLLCAGLPIKLRVDAQPTKQQTSSPVADFLVPCTRSFLFLTCLAVLHPHTAPLPLYVVHYLYCAQIFLTLDLVFSSVGLVAAAALGTAMERQFRAPLVVASVNDFWGRQWNLMAVDLLRASAYAPVRARWGRDAGVLAAFLMSGVLHELLYWYMTLEHPTGEMLLFFTLHAAVHVAERWAKLAGLWRPPKAAAYVVGTGFMVVTISEFFFGPFIRAGIDVRMMEESTAAVELLRAVAKRLIIRPFGHVSG